ncbi:MAG: autotransporter domain-containing protein [Alphaproteobacteria bacterium]|nr:autotransporter domain-containing protein [Alphaproteobacteria bacterium]
MKKTLLMTTALVAVMSATNVYATDLTGKVERPDNINIESSTEYTIDNAYSEQSGDLDEGTLYTSTVNVDKGGKLTVSSSDIVADGSGDAVTLKGTVILDGTSIMAGNKYPNAKQNMIIDGADITFKTTSDLLSATGDLNVSNASIDASSLVADGGGDEEDLSGLRSLGNITIDNSKIYVPDLMIVSGLDNPDGTGEPLGEGNITISGSSEINVKEIGVYGKGDININGGSITTKDIGAEQGSVTISNGTVNMTMLSGTDSEGLYARDNMTIKGGTVNMSGNGNRIWGKNIAMSGGTLNIKDSTTFETENPIDISGGTVNIAENSSLGWSNVTDDSDIDLGSNAVLNLAGTLNASIESPGTINILNNNTKIVGSVEISNGGVMNVGLNKATIGGDITFDTGSTLKLSVADDGNGSVSARNIVAEKDAKLALTVSKKMEIGDTAKVKLFDTTGKFDNGFVEEISNNRYKVEALKNADNKFTGEYNIKYENSASNVVADAGGSVNNAKTAEAWDSISSSTSASVGAKAVASVLSDLSQNNEQAYVAALTAVAPEAAPAVQSASTENANQVFGAVGTRLSGGSVSTGGEGMSSGDNIFERAAVWVQTLFNKSKLDDTSKSKGFNADTNGIAFGAEKFVNDDVKVGVGYAYSQTDIDGFMRSTDVDTHTAIVYGEYKPSNWYVNGIATYGWSDYSEKKNVAGVGVKADYDVETFGLQAMTGYDMNVKGFGLTPEAGLRYVHIKQDAYKDSADQKVSGNDSDILTGVIGAKVSKSWELSNGMNIKPEARIAATYDLMNDNVNSVVTLANGSAYAVEGKALDRFGMEFGAGVTAEVNDKVELSLGYEGKFREDYQDHTGLINAKYKF